MRGADAMWHFSIFLEEAQRLVVTWELECFIVTPCRHVLATHGNAGREQQADDKAKQASCLEQSLNPYHVW